MQQGEAFTPRLKIILAMSIGGGGERMVAVRIPLTSFQDPDGCEMMLCVGLSPGGDCETPGVHHAGRRCSSLAAHDRGPAQQFADMGDRGRDLDMLVVPRPDVHNCKTPQINDASRVG